MNIPVLTPHRRLQPFRNALDDGESSLGPGDEDEGVPLLLEYRPYGTAARSTIEVCMVTCRQPRGAVTVGADLIRGLQIGYVELDRVPGSDCFQ